MAQAPTPNGATIFTGISSDPANVLNQFLDSDGHFKWTLSNTTVILDVSSTGDIRLHGLLYPGVDGTAGQVLTTDGAGTLSFQNGTPGPPGPPGGVNGSGAATQIAVWSDAADITGYTDFTWDNAGSIFHAGPTSTITPGANILDLSVGGFVVGNTIEGSDQIVIGGSNSVEVGSANADDVVVGNLNTVNGGSNLVFGSENILGGSGLTSVLAAFGRGNTVDGSTSYAFGDGNTVSDGSSDAFGLGNTINGGGDNVAVGQFITITGSSSAAFGEGLTVTHNIATVIGNGTNSVADSSVSLGVSATPEVTITGGTVTIDVNTGGPNPSPGSHTLIITDSLLEMGAGEPSFETQVFTAANAVPGSGDNGLNLNVSSGQGDSSGTTGGTLQLFANGPTAGDGSGAGGAIIVFTDPGSSGTSGDILLRTNNAASASGNITLLIGNAATPGAITLDRIGGLLTVFLPSLPTTAPLGSKQLWCDVADGRVLKLTP